MKVEVTKELPDVDVMEAKVKKEMTVEEVIQLCLSQVASSSSSDLDLREGGWWLSW